jgi:hypothetical protein
MKNWQIEYVLFSYNTKILKQNEYYINKPLFPAQFTPTKKKCA